MTKRLYPILILILLALPCSAQDTLRVVMHDTVVLTQTDTMVLTQTDTVIRQVVDSTQLKALQERIKLLEEKEAFYREICGKSGIDKDKIENDRDRYRHRVDSLQSSVRLCELENVRKDEANKYLEQRAKDAEARVAESTNRKKKVRSIQGIAMRFYRTPNYEVRLYPQAGEQGKYDKKIVNRNSGNIEFDFVTGASVMLWDLTQYFNKEREPRTTEIGNTGIKTPELRKFDQDFAYDIGIYVGFGGSNLFKNFYVGPSFRFVDFFYLTVGVNIAEYEVLVSGYEEGMTLDQNLSVDDITAKAWLLKPFVALSIDLDFLSYIKK